MAVEAKLPLKGLTIKDLQIKMAYNSTKTMTVEPKYASLFAIAIIFTFFMICCLVRSLLRRANQQKTYVGKLDKAREILKSFKEGNASKLCDWSLVLSLLVWLMISGWSAGLSIYFNEIRIVLWGSAASFSIIMFLRSLVFLSMMDFFYV